MLGPHQRPQFDPQDLALLRAAESTANSSAAYPELDLATARLYARVLAQPAHRSFLESILEGPSPVPIADLKAGIVPGAFYRQHRNTGADGAQVRAILNDLGIDHEIVPIQSFGRVESNAAILGEWLRRQSGRRVMLISLSKGGADAKAALRDGAESGWEKVMAWVNLSGLVQGTPLIAWLRRQPLRMMGVHLLLWLRGQNFAAADDLRHGVGTPLADWPALPSTLRLVHVMGFPLRRHLRHRWAPRAYERLAPLGPNDGGGILLGDALHLPGVVCPVWGVDHYLSPSWDVTPFLRNIIRAAAAPVSVAATPPHPQSVR